jgi:hypothetical protein
LEYLQATVADSARADFGLYQLKGAAQISRFCTLVERPSFWVRPGLQQP